MRHSEKLATLAIALTLGAGGCDDVNRERRELEQQRTRLEARQVEQAKQLQSLIAGRDPATLSEDEKATIAPLAAHIQ